MPRYGLQKMRCPLAFYDRIAPVDSLDEAAALAATQAFAQLDMTAFNGTKNKSRKALLELLDECIEADLIAP